MEREARELRLLADALLRVTGACLASATLRASSLAPAPSSSPAAPRERAARGDCRFWSHDNRSATSRNFRHYRREWSAPAASGGRPRSQEVRRRGYRHHHRRPRSSHSHHTHGRNRETFHYRSRERRSPHETSVEPGRRRRRSSSNRGGRRRNSMVFRRVSRSRTPQDVPSHQRRHRSRHRGRRRTREESRSRGEHRRSNHRSRSNLARGRSEHRVRRYRERSVSREIERSRENRRRSRENSRNPSNGDGCCGVSSNEHRNFIRENASRPTFWTSLNLLPVESVVGEGAVPDCPSQESTPELERTSLPEDAPSYNT